MSDELEAVLDAGDPDRDLPFNDVDNSATKAEAAVTLAMYGASPTDIAKTLHYSSPYRARMAVERALASAANSPDDKEKVRKLVDKRLNRLLSSVMSKAIDPTDPQHLAYNARALAIVDRQAKLHGVDAATQIQFSASDQYIEEFVNSIRPLADANMLAIEADILEEGEIVEEGDIG